MNALGRFLLATLAAASLWGEAALADTPDPARGASVIGMPHNWQIGMQAPASPVATRLQDLNLGVSIVIVLISLFVGALLAWVLFRYSAKRNPVAGTVSHNSVLEALWTTLPVLILVGIFIPSIRLVYYEDRTHDPALTVKVTGHQWYWEYTYPDSGDYHFESYVVADEDLKPDQKAMRHLLADRQLVVPVGKDIRILTTSADVIHSFFIPSLGVQRYAIPGRTIETWMRVDRPGDYYGECNQICGMNHSMMPISVHAVSPEQFQAWLNQVRAKHSTASAGGHARLALASEH